MIVDYFVERNCFFDVLYLLMFCVKVNVLIIMLLSDGNILIFLKGEFINMVFVRDFDIVIVYFIGKI